MQPRRILVTGAGGFVGRHLMTALRAAFPAASLIPAAFDVREAEAVRAAVREGQPDALVHLAGIAAPAQARQEPDAAWHVNLHGTLNVARAVLAAAPSCIMLHVSSGDAYGASFRRQQKVDESAALTPLNTYAATKAAADLALGAMVSDGLRCIRFRPLNHTGPGQSAAFVVPAFSQQIARIEAGLQEPVLQVGALAPVRDFLDVRDVCAAYISALARGNDIEPGTILNIASGQGRRIGDILQDLLASAGVRAEIRTDESRLRAADVPVAVGDAGAAARLLDWSAHVPWEQTLADVLADWRARVRQS